MTKAPSPDKLAMIGYYHVRMHLDKATFVNEGKPFVISGARHTSYEIVAIKDIVNAVKKLLDYDLNPNVFSKMGEHGIAVAGKNIVRGAGDPGIFMGCTITKVERDGNGLLQVSLEDEETKDDGNKDTYSAVVKDRIVNGRREYTVIKMVVNKDSGNKFASEPVETLQTFPSDVALGAFVNAGSDPYEFMAIDETKIACSFDQIKKFGFDLGDWVKVEYKKQPSPDPKDNDKMVNTCVSGKVIGKFSPGSFNTASENYFSMIRITEWDHISGKYKLWLKKKDEKGKPQKTTGTIRVSDGLLLFFGDSEPKTDKPSFAMRFTYGGLAMANKNLNKFMESEFTERFKYSPRHSRGVKGQPDIRPDELPQLAELLVNVYFASCMATEKMEGLDLTQKKLSPEEMARLGIFYIRCFDNYKSYHDNGKSIPLYKNEITRSYFTVAISDISDFLYSTFDYKLDKKVLDGLRKDGLMVVDDTVAMGAFDPALPDECMVTSVKRDESGLLHVSLEEIEPGEDEKISKYSGIVKDDVEDGIRWYNVIKVVKDEN